MQNKRSLAAPRRDNKPTGGHSNNSSKKSQMKASQEKGSSVEKSSTFSTSQTITSHRYQQRYRNKNLHNLPAQLLLAFSSLTTIDISYNKLTDAEIQLMVGSSTKLTTLCIEGNMTYLIPAAIGKLKHLVKFRHDWCKLNYQQHFQTPQRLRKIMQSFRRPDVMTKVNRIVGLDFIGYCQNVLQTHMDINLLQRIQKVDFSTFARQNVLKIMADVVKGKVKEKGRLATVNQSQQRSLIPGCFGFCNFQQPKQEITRKKESHPRVTMVQSSQVTSNIRIEDIKDINLKQFKLARGPEIRSYKIENMPLHKLFSNFDSNPNAPAEIDSLLLRNYNPNQLDQNGLSPYHICVIYKQKKGLQHLIQISSNNPGFFDLQILSKNEGRSILHLAVFLKNYPLTKMLIQFGLPVDRRDSSGSRIVNLVDRNSEFLMLLRKLLKKRSNFARSLTALSIQNLPHLNKKNYSRHPQRVKIQMSYQVNYSRNNDLLNLYERATGIGGGR